MGPRQSKINTTYLQFTDEKWVLRDVNQFIQGLEEAWSEEAAAQVFWLLGSSHKMARGASHPTLPVRGPEALAGLTFQRVIFKKCMNMYWAAAQGIFWRFYFRSLPGSKVCPGEGISQNGLWKER